MMKIIFIPLFRWVLMIPLASLSEKGVDIVYRGDAHQNVHVNSVD